MSSKTLQRTVSGLGVLLILLGLMAFPPRGPIPSSAAVYDYFWRDDFSTDTLHPLWSWVREDATHWSLTDNPDFLRITTQEGGIVQTTNNQQNILVTNAPTGDFQITTKVTFDPSANYQVAAIHVYQDDDNFIQLNRGYTGGNAVNFDIEIGGVFTSIQAPEAATTIWLRIARELNTYSAFTSTDGAAWTLVGQHTTAALTNAKIGLNATHYFDAVPEIPADFEYFELEANFPSFGLAHTDGFTSTTLHPAWSWINEDPAFWSLTDRPGFMRLTTYDGATEGKNLLVQDAPVGTYATTTRLLFTPSSNFQMAGLIVYGAGDNFLMFGRAYCDPALGCAGNAIYFDNIDGGGFGENFATVVPDPDEAYLRVVREGRTYSGYASPDGVNWMLIGRHTISPSRVLPYIGITVGNDQLDVRIPADFDHFELLHNFAVFLPAVLRNY